MKQTWRQSNAAKAALIVLTILALWGTLLSGAGVLVELVNLYNTDGNDVGKAYTQQVLQDARGNLENYLNASVQNYEGDAQVNYEFQDGYGTFYQFTDRSTALTYFEQEFDPAETNLRFHIADSSGRIILENDAADRAEAEPLGTVSMPVAQPVSSKSYSVQQHFDSLAQVQAAQMSDYLEAPEDYQLWFFTYDDVDAAYNQGLEVRVLNELYTTAQVFDTVADARSFNYEDAYGSHVTWEIVRGEAAADALSETADEDEQYAADTAAVVVLVTAYESQEEYWTSLDDYYALKESNDLVEAADPALEARLSSGLDVTIKAQETVSELFTMTVWLPAGLPVNDAIRSNYTPFQLLYGKAELISAAMFLFGMVTVLAAIAMCTAAGHTTGTDGIVIPTVHKLPYEFFWLLPVGTLAAAAASLEAVRFASYSDSWRMAAANWRLTAIFGAGMLLCTAAAGVLWLYTTAIRAKSGTFWSSFGFVRLFRAFFGLFRHRTLTCIATALAGGFLFLFNLAAFETNEFLLIVPAIGMDLLALLGVLYSTYSYFTLHQHLVQIEQGDFEPRRYVIPLQGDFLRFDQELNALTDTVSVMVADQMKAEKMRTELITNVSHDLKTPLTSIVNYVDLLSREPMQSEEAAEYLDVLRRQAARLKKLTTDLVDASKASTGNVAVEMQVTNVQVLLGQFAGEYDERLQESGLELVTHLPELPLYILADGRQSWRIFDNLLNNACKYAMRGTRIYLDVTADDRFVYIRMKNISADPLNVSPDELMERFVRGDASRHTEGSGLGLSIARDLAALQGGTLSLSADGDLFKAELRFPRYEEPMLPAEPED